MPNALDVAPVRKFAARVATLIPDAAISARYEKLAFGRMLLDDRNFRAATFGEVMRALPWAQEAHARGELLSVFRLHPGAASSVRTTARRIARTCALAALDPAKFVSHSVGIGEAGAFLDKFSRVDFDTAARKALAFSRFYAAIEDELACKTPAAEISATSGRVWRRVRTVSELRLIGREFHNCLARTPRHASYGAMIARGGQFWVLRDALGVGLVVALAQLRPPMRFTEVRGPRNAPIPHDQEDLALLASGLGIAPPAPPLPLRRPEIITFIERLQNVADHAALLRPLARAH